MSREASAAPVILVHVNFPQGKMAQDLSEFNELARAAGAKTAAVITGTRKVPDAKFFVGKGKAEEIAQAVAVYDAELVLINHDLSPAQERNLERLIQCRVLDRTGLILDIFAQRARSFEGNLQVELAQLKHLATRLVRGWTHLERQRGGIGLRGPGETQLETDRRLIRNRMKVIDKRLEKLRRQRDQARRARRKATIPTVALVGYTNAGKSTLFNRLTGADVFVANQLFATLDPTLRRVELPDGGPIILADTVGFIRHLPHNLVEAFHATLEEVAEADLLLHVVDATDEAKDLHIEQVNKVLETIQADFVPKISVFNKIDQNDLLTPYVHLNELGNVDKVYISALSGAGLTELKNAIGRQLHSSMSEEHIVLLPEQGKLRAELYRHGAILTENIDAEGNYHLHIRLPKVEFEKLFR